MTFTAAATSLDLRFSGTLHTPDSTGYDDARAIWNGQIDRHPRLIATCANTKDVASAVRYAVSNQLRFSVRGGGHHVAGSALVDDGVVIDLSAMTDVTLDAGRNRVVVQGGAKLGDLDRATLPFGHLTPAGIDADTGVGGLTLGGGIGWSMRLYGLTCDNLMAVTLVTATGDTIHVDDESDPELMWGLRGGGGNFGIVTEFEFQTHPVPDEVLAGFIVYDGSDAVSVLEGYRAIASEFPDDLTTIVFLRTAPPVPWMPPEAVGRPVVLVGAVWLGDSDVGEDVLAPLRNLAPSIVDTIAPKPMLEHQMVLEGANPVGHRYYWKSAPLGGLSDGVIETLATHLENVSSPHSMLGFFQLGGAVARNGELGCFPTREAGFLVNYAVHWVDPDEDEFHRQWTRNAMAEIEPYAIGGGYVNFLAEGGADAVRAAYGDARFERLVKLKTRLDPDNIFRHNQNIPPRN